MKLLLNVITRRRNKLETKASSHEGQCIPAGYCHAHINVKVKVSTLDIAPLRGTPPQKRPGTDHTVLPANFTVPAAIREWS